MAYNNVSRKGCFKCGNRASLSLSHTPTTVSYPSVLPILLSLLPPFNRLHAWCVMPVVGHIAENCTSQERLCYNCRKAGHESSACPEPRSVSAKQCYSCGGIGHIQAECPTLRLQGSNQKCYVRPRSTQHTHTHTKVVNVQKKKKNCGHFGHIARVCPNDAVDYGFATRAPPPGRGLNVASLPPVKCYRCGGPNHMARYAKKKRHAASPTVWLIFFFCRRTPGTAWLRRTPSRRT